MTSATTPPATQSVIHLAEACMQPRPPEYQPTGPAAQRFDVRSARLGPLMGLTHLGCGLMAVAPGKQAFPFHSHRQNDELFLILAGQGELRLGTQRYAVREGDVIGCPAGGAASAHALTNTGRTELRYLAISSQHVPEICEYPDSGKFGVFDSPLAQAQGLTPIDHLTRLDRAVDYWDGE